MGNLLTGFEERVQRLLCVDCALNGLIVYLLMREQYITDPMQVGITVAVLGMITKPILNSLM